MILGEEDDDTEFVFGSGDIAAEDSDGDEWNY